MTTHHHRPQPTPSSAVRAELRAALHDLSDFLLADGRPDPSRVLDAVVHAWALFRLSELDEASQTLVATTLEGLTHDLGTELRLDTEYYANRLSLAAARI